MKTYTFPVSKTYLNDKSENLVVKENADHSFSGVLIQYDLTREEQQKFIAGEITDIKSKIRIYDIDKLNIASRVQTDVVGCYVITWETGWCSAGVHQTGSDNACTVGGVPAPMVLSVQNTCDDSGGGDSGGTGNGGWIGVGTGGGSLDLGGVFTTFPFVSLGYQYYETEDPFDPNYIHYTNVANYFISLGTELNQLRVTNPDLFYYAFFYFKDHGITPSAKAFITQRLAGLNAWYATANNNPDAIAANNQYFLNWAFRYLVIDHPDKSWQEFYNEYLATPCEKTKSMLQKPKVQQAIQDVNNQAKKAALDAYEGEIGRIEKNGDFYPADVSEDHHVTFNNINGAKGIYHNHTYNGAKMHSPQDIYSILSFAQQQPSSNYGDTYVGMIGAQKCYPVAAGCYRIFHYLIRFSGTTADLSKSFTEDEMKKLEDNYRKRESELRETLPYVDFLGDTTLNKKGYEKLFFETLAKMGLSGKVILQRVDDDGKIYNINLDANGIPEAIPCP